MQGYPYKTDEMTPEEEEYVYSESYFKYSKERQFLRQEIDNQLKHLDRILWYGNECEREDAYKEFEELQTMRDDLSRLSDDDFRNWYGYDVSPRRVSKAKPKPKPRLSEKEKADLILESQRRNGIARIGALVKHFVQQPMERRFAEARRFKNYLEEEALPVKRRKIILETEQELAEFTQLNADMKQIEESPYKFR